MEAAMKTLLALVMLLTAFLLSGCASTGGGLSQVIAADAQVQLVQEGFVFTEGPLSATDGGLYFTDLQKAQRIYRMTAHGAISVLREKSNNVNGLAYTPKGELIGVESLGRRIVRIAADGSFSEITRGDGKTPMMLPNDLIADARGGIYFT